MQFDFGKLEFHGLITVAYSESEVGIAGTDYGALEYHGLLQYDYAVSNVAVDPTIGIVYIDPVGGNDAWTGANYVNSPAGTGPKKTLGTGEGQNDGASKAAGTNGEVRYRGLAEVSLGTALWTNNSTTVLFSTNPGLAAADHIYPVGGVDYNGDDAVCPFYVSSQAGKGQYYRVTLSYKWQGATGVYTTNKLTLQSWTYSQNMTTGATGQKISFGWDFVNGGQPVGYWTAIYNVTTNMYYFYITQLDTLVDVSRCMCTAVAGNSIMPFTLSNSCRVKGTIRYGAFGSGAVNTGASGSIEIDAVIAAFTTSFNRYGLSVTGTNLNIRVGRIMMHNATGISVSANNRGLIQVGKLVEIGAIGASTMASGSGGTIQIGHYYIRNGPVGIPPYTLSTMSSYVIGYLDALDINGAPVIPTGAGIRVCGPVGQRRYVGVNGTVTDVVGPGGRGWGWRFDPTSSAAGVSGRRPVVGPTLDRPVAAGSALSISFKAVYTGTAADVPECWVELLTENGFKLAKYSFTPTYCSSTNLADVWAASSTATVTFTRSATANGFLGCRVCCVDNNAADSVLYVGPVTWVAT